MKFSTFLNRFSKPSIFAIALLSAANVNAQTWGSTTVPTWTPGNSVIGAPALLVTVNPPTLLLESLTAENANRNSLTISNHRAANNTTNIVNVYGIKPFPNPADYFFIIDGIGKVGVGMQPNAAKPFNFSVAGRSYFSDKMVIGNNINLNTPGTYNLYVQGGVLTEKVKVASSAGVNWADFVFDESYELKPLEEVETFISKNKHLPDVPSAAQVNKDGIDLAQMDATLLQKIEELTLYMIELKKDNAQLHKDNAQLRKDINALKK